jgi:pyruvate/2-oxoglutarate dehydrogenase complex dihydrolipoamide acyltransferase (E2) component
MREFKLPDLGEGIVQAEVVQWHVAEGELVARGQTIVEVMTDKAAVELPAPFSGTVRELLAEPGQRVDVGTVLLRYEPSSSEAAPKPDTLQPTRLQTSAPPPSSLPPSPVAAPRVGQTVAEQSSTSTRSATGYVAAPSVRRMARQLGIDLATVAGTGPHQRILIDDLAAAVKQTSTGQPANGSSADHHRHGATQLTPGTRLPIRGLRRTIVERMTRAQQTIPQFSYIDELDVSDLVALRASLKGPLASQGVKLTYLPFFVKAVVAALQEVPIANASIDTAADEIVLHDHYHIGIATDTAAGLTVPVLRDADQQTIPQLASEIERLTNAARRGQATVDQYQGNTFTITSTGNLGGLISTPIINEPAVGIMGIGQIVKRPRFAENGTIRAADVLYLSFSFDHRVVDGADAARFANAVIRQLGNPAALLLSTT